MAGRGEGLAPPSRGDVEAKMIGLLNGALTRREVADWASVWVREDNPNVDDDVVWKSLLQLSGADLESSPGMYLHDEIDLQSWFDELRPRDEGQATDTVPNRSETDASFHRDP